MTHATRRLTLFPVVASGILAGLMACGSSAEPTAPEADAAPSGTVGAIEDASSQPGTDASPADAKAPRPDSGGSDSGGDASMALRAVKVSLGSGHACALLSDGRVKCWGSNNSGQLGLGDVNDRGDEPGEMGAKLPSVDLGPGRTAKELALTAQATCALLDDSTVKCWGYVRPITGVDLNIGEEPGQMGAALAPLALPGKVKHITAGYQHLCAIFDDGTTRCFGGPADSGELGVGDKVVRLAGAPLLPVNLGAGRTAAKVGPSTVHTCALLDDATVKCWGYGGNGELGSGSTAETLAPGAALDFGAGRTVRDLAVSAQPIVATLPSGYGCVVLDTGSVKCWGFDSAGLGVGWVPNAGAHKGDQPGEMGDALAAVDLGQGKKAVAVAVGQSLASQVTMSCALLDDATVKCWGYNAYGTLGVGDRVDRGATLASMGAALAPIDLGAGVKVASVSVTSGGYAVQGLSACAVTDTGRVKCWGLNRKGILGLGDTRTRGDTPATMGTALPYVDLF